MFRLIDADTLEIDLDVEPNLPYAGAVPEWIQPGLTGKVLMTKTRATRSLQLCRNGTEIALSEDPRQKGERGVRGTDLWEQQKLIPGLLHPNELDALYAYPDFIPVLWAQGLDICAWGMVFCDRSGDRSIRRMFWRRDNRWDRYYICLRYWFRERHVAPHAAGS